MKLSLIFLILNVFLFHPIHLSVTNIEYNQKTKHFDISIRIFVNDLEHIIDAQNHVVLNIGKKNENPQTNKYINKYISSHLFLNINNRKINPKKFVLKKREIKDITIWLHYSIRFNENISNIEIKNILMTDLYRDQKNLLIFTYHKKQTPLEFSLRNNTKVLKF